MMRRIWNAMIGVIGAAALTLGAAVAPATAEDAPPAFAPEIAQPDPELSEPERIETDQPADEGADPESLEAAPGAEQQRQDVDRAAAAETVNLKGISRVGSRLTARASFAGATLQWYRNDKKISATGANYTPAARDRGARIKACASSPGDPQKQICSASVSIGYGVQSAKKPKITGKFAAGKRLKVSTKGWVGSKTYQWYVGGKKVKGKAGKRSYLKLTKKHVGKRVHVRVTSKRAGYKTLKLSTAKHKIASKALRSAVPKMWGSSTVGDTLEVNPGRWTQGAKLKYQWFVNGKAVKGATKWNFKLKKTHLGSKVYVRVTGSKKHYASERRASKAVTVRTMEEEMLRLVNNARSKARKCGSERMPEAGPLVLDAKLNKAARLHSEDMAKHNYFDHIGRDGSDPWDRAQRAGIDAFSENIAAGSSTPKDTLDQWLNSPGHCSSVMNGGYVAMGIGKGYHKKSSYGTYWTQMFR